MSFTYMGWIEKYNLNFQLHINETEESPIFKQMNLKEKVDNLMKYNKVIVNVVSTQRINKKYYYKIKYQGSLIGWCCPSENSIMYLRTKKQEIKLIEESRIDNELNGFLEIDLSKMRGNSDKIFLSDCFALFNDNVYCAVTLKDELLGFVIVDNISFFNHSRNDFKFIESNISLYKNSKLEKLEMENFEPGGNHYTSLGWFENFEGVRVIIDGKRYWVNMKNTDLEVENKKLQSSSETIIDTLIYQLNDKLTKQAEFYNSKIQKLEKNLEEYKEKEKLLNQSVKNFKEIL